MKARKDRSKVWGICQNCNNPAFIELHHIIPRCEGGAEGPTIPVCVNCHIAIHQLGDAFRRWGASGGQKTAEEHPETWRANLSKGPTARWGKKKSTIVES